MIVCADFILNSVLDQLLNVDCLNIEVRNLVVKLLQRIALVLLRPRLADWRYKCGYRSLETSLKGKKTAKLSLDKQSNECNDTEISKDVNMDEDYEVPYDVVCYKF